MKNRILLSLLLSLCFFGAQSQTTIPALITTNQVWTISGSPYLLNQNSYIDSGVTVIVKPGVEIITSSTNKIDVNGEFQAVGTWDSVIEITKVRMNFSAKCRDYNPTTNRGTLFTYCNIEGNGSGSTALELTNTAVKMDHCMISNAHFGVSIMGAYPYEQSITEITNSKFYGVTSFNSGSPIYCNNMQSKLRVSNCLFSNAWYVNTYGNVVFTNNSFYKLQSVSFGYMYGDNEISCNKFYNMSQGVTVDATNYNIRANITFKNNTLDSIGTANMTFYNMFTLNKKPSNTTPKDSIVILNNNFLWYLGKGAKAAITATNYTPTKTDTVNFRSNYWGTSDSATIEGVIKDYKDDINIYGRIDFASFLTTPIVGCSYNGGCAIANFNYSIADSVVTFNDSSYSTRTYKVKWKFGDGVVNDSNKKTITHTYEPGVYQVCMYTYDSLNNLCDSMCKNITITSNTTCHASYYFAIDTTDLSIVYVVNTSTGINSKTKYYWTFGDGTGSSATNPTHSYPNQGKYQLCLTIFDTTANCYSTFCDSVDINFNNMNLRVIDDINVLKIDKSNIVSSMAVYPNPSKGQLSIFLNSFESGDVQIEILGVNGQLIKSGNYPTNAGTNEIHFNLADYDNGLYCLNIRSGNYSKTLKVIIQK